MAEAQGTTQVWEVPGRGLRGTAEAVLLAVGALFFLSGLTTGQGGRCKPSCKHLFILLY